MSGAQSPAGSGGVAAAYGVQVLVLCKRPIPGRVKTRLCPPLSPLDASRLASAAIADTVQAVTLARVVRRVLVLDDGSPARAAEVAVAAPGFDRIAQRGGTLDERLAAAFDDAAAGAGLPLLLVGMDTPQLTAQLVERACSALLADGVDAVHGLAEDGGWWALGLRRPAPALLLGVLPSRTDTGRSQRARLDHAGLRVADLPVLRDVDTIEDARAVAELAPHLRFSALLRELPTAADVA